MRRSWRKAARQAGVDVWTRSDTSWDLADPPEDHALPPDLGWTQQQHEDAQREYAAVYGRFLEPDEVHEMSWPPEGSLWDAGDWTGGAECSEHGPDESCDDCEGLAPDQQEVLTPAQWDWYVTVTTWEEWSGPDGEVFASDEGSNHHLLTSTEMDPREVEYGPHRNSPARSMLVQAFWQQQPQAQPAWGRRPDRADTG